MGEPHRQPLDMDSTTLVTNLTLDWRLIERSPQGRQLLRRLQVAAPPGAFEAGLEAALSPAGPLSTSERAGVLSHLLALAAEEPLAARGLVQALLPGLRGVARQLDYGVGGPWSSGGHLLVDLVATCFEVITNWAGQVRPFAGPDLLSAVRLRARRQRAHHRARRHLPLSEVAEPQGLPDPAELALARAAADLDDPRDAVVVVGRLCCAWRWAELEEALGESRRRLERRLHRGARRILEDADLASAPTSTDAR